MNSVYGMENGFEKRGGKSFAIYVCPPYMDLVCQCVFEGEHVRPGCRVQYIYFNTNACRMRLIFWLQGVGRRACILA